MEPQVRTGNEIQRAPDRLVLQIAAPDALVSVGTNGMSGIL
jgi:hypothetical protein